MTQCELAYMTWKEVEELQKQGHEIGAHTLSHINVAGTAKEELEKEKTNILIASFDDDEMLGCCMLSPLNKETVQLRQMAVPDNLQGKGIGASMMSFAELVARDKGFKKLLMHARKTAVGFYEKLGYKVAGDEFVEVTIPHYLMEKKL